ncbi:hypothetical protein H0H93_015264 [Arthromyces matolae]|nr:hypothetical protein H0H93_015264 [Arthromyces matolae]
MATTALATFEELSPELFSVIAAHLSLHNRVPTLLSLALASHHFCNIIIPHVLYTCVRLVGEEKTVPVLNGFIQSATQSTDKRHITIPSHHIHDLCIYLQHAHDSDTSLVVLQRLIDSGGLPNLHFLTLHREDDVPPIPTAFWTSIQNHCPDFQGIHLTGLVQVAAAEWIESELLTTIQKGMKSIRLEGRLVKYESESEPAPYVLDLTKLPIHLHTLDLQLSSSYYLAIEGLLSSVMPNLRVLILGGVKVSKPSMAKHFWKNHPSLVRLELLGDTRGDWFNDFESGMLPNLRILKSNFISARILLPHLSRSLTSLCVLGTYNAQAPYLLRVVPKDGTLPALRSLGIQRFSGNSSKPYEGHCWREDESGAVTQVPFYKSARKFDGNYLMSIAKGAPNLEELELMGESNDTIDSITSALGRLSKLTQLTLSGPTNMVNLPFFESCRNWVEYEKLEDPISADELQQYAYAPASFDQAAYDLARGCPALERVTIGKRIGELLFSDGVSGRIVRDGTNLKVQRIQAWGNDIGKELDW